MQTKQIVINALLSEQQKITDIDTPLDNEFVLDDHWLIEMDCDGAFAATVSEKNKPLKEYDETYKIVVFRQMNRESESVDQSNADICLKIMDVIQAFNK